MTDLQGNNPIVVQQKTSLGAVPLTNLSTPTLLSLIMSLPPDSVPSAQSGEDHSLGLE